MAACLFWPLGHRSCQSPPPPSILPSSFSEVLLTLRFYTSPHGFPMSCPHLYKDYHMCVNYFVHVSKYIEYISPYTSPFCLSSAHHFPLVSVGPLELLLLSCYMYLHKIQDPQMRRSIQCLSFRGWFNSLYVIISAVSIFPCKQHSIVLCLCLKTSIVYISHVFFSNSLLLDT